MKEEMKPVEGSMEREEGTDNRRGWGWISDWRGKYRTLLRVLLLVVVFFIGVGQVSLNRDSSTSLEQPVLRFTSTAWSGLSFSIGGKLENLVLPLLLLWAAGLIWDRTIRPPKSPLYRPLLLFLSLAVLAYLLSPFRELSWRDGLRELLLGGGFLVAAGSILSAKRDREIALGVLFCSVGLSALAGIWLFRCEVYFPPTPQRIWLSFMHPNTAGSALLLLIPVGLALAAGDISRSLRILCGLAAVILTAAMILTFSRTAWLGLLAGLSVLALYWRRRYYLLGGLALLAGLLILGVNVGPQSYLQTRVKSLSNFTRDPNIEKRLVYWQGVARMIRVRPLTGYGPGYRVFMEAYERDFKIVETDENPVHAHNMYLSLAVGVGIPGLLAFFWLIGAAWRGLNPGNALGVAPFRRYFFRGLTAGLAGFLIGGLADNPFFSFRVMLVFWLLLALGNFQESGLLKLVEEPALE